MLLERRALDDVDDGVERRLEGSGPVGQTGLLSERTGGPFVQHRSRLGPGTGGRGTGGELRSQPGTAGHQVPPGQRLSRRQVVGRPEALGAVGAQPSAARFGTRRGVR